MLQFAVTEASSVGMNTDITYRVFGQKAELAVADAKAELSRLENKLSRFIPDSEISKINMFAGKGRVKISYETYEVLSFALLLSEISQDLFDITLGPLIDLWDYKHSFHVPEEAKIQSALFKVNFRDLLLNSQDNTASLRKAGQSIDLGGIGKGYASDRFIEILQEHGVSSAFINIGGNVSTLGKKSDGSPWSVGIRHPRRDNCLLGAVKVISKAVVTSGDYERYFIDSTGTRRHHILNPVTGYPAESGLISVTVVNDNAMIADALSTAIFVAGIDKGIEYLEHFPGAEAVLVDNRQQVFITQGLKECYQTAEGIEVNII
ncbi:FAD:protein FMN transferase [Clostridium sp. BNL1100]|uniref:FAD:protein FMN transferase n=1 Tax=Clostridium sp. BNL1100 TaxID=755731 RepID=UPI00024A79B0|nr:FAD:protein FMN transferase [Clostridium sp. BNL1100]AEY67887.1 membrane-associated lipoprotein involved in thiamine biosynthesis [Clostridium sp. BNL1100]